MNAPPALTIVLPCFNEGPRIAASLATLHAWFGDGIDVLIVDDASADDTVEQAEGAATGGPRRVHRLPRHRGKGGAIRSAIPLVRTERVVIMDADVVFDRQSVQRIIDALDAADVAIANRRHPGSRYSVPVRLFGFLYRRHVVGLAFNAFVRASTGLTLHDTQCGLKGFRRETLARMAPALSIDGFALDVELLLVAAAMKVRLVEVPVNVRYESAKSSVRLVQDAWAMARDMVRIAVRRARGAYGPSRLEALAAASAPRNAD